MYTVDIRRYLILDVRRCKSVCYVVLEIYTVVQVRADAYFKLLILAVCRKY